MKKYITILILCLTNTIFAQKIDSISLGGLHFSDETLFISTWNTCKSCDGYPFEITGGYTINAPITRYCEGRTLVTSETRTFRQNEYRYFVPQQNTYKIIRKKIVGWSLVAVGGAADGLLEGYLHDGRTSFERKWNANKTGFWGSESWRMVYNGGDPEQGFKSGFAKWNGANDFYHIVDDTRKVGYITGGIMIGIGGASKNDKLWHYAVDFAVSFAVSAVSKSLAYKYIRN